MRKEELMVKIRKRGKEGKEVGQGSLIYHMDNDE
jgi:hypothetical protein